MASVLTQNDGFLRILIANAADRIIVIDSYSRYGYSTALANIGSATVLSCDGAMLMPPPQFDRDVEELARRGNIGHAP
jgi:hypothetical protein